MQAVKTPLPYHPPPHTHNCSVQFLSYDIQLYYVFTRIMALQIVFIFLFRELNWTF
uniref:Uncharacterized protein n=1 Tax=Anguilla anguilla TaxID=7936 RepID=A0A0E9V8X6_ANGAN